MSGPAPEVPTAAAEVAVFVPPRTAGPATTLGVLLSLALLAVGLVLLHDGLVLVGWITADQWLIATADAIGTLEPTVVVAWVSAGLAAVGIVLLIAGFVPRRRYGMRVRGDGGLYLREVDVARLASGAARGTGVVLEASSTASRRRVVVRARTTVDQDAADLTRSAVVERLSVLREPPVVVVRARGPR